MSFRPAARQFFERRGGGGWQNPYVTDGLVAMWDGAWNAGGGVHDQNATSWVDLVGSANLTLAGDCTWGTSYCRINGENNAAFASYNSVLATQNSGWTFHFVFAPLKATSYVSRPYSLRKDVDGVERYLTNGTNNGIFTGNGSSLRERQNLFSSNVGDHISEHFVVTPDGALNVYVEDSLVNTQTVKVPASIPFVGIGNSMSQAGNRGCNEDIYLLGIYNQTLTAEEISANYAIDKARFNLP